MPRAMPSRTITVELDLEHPDIWAQPAEIIRATVVAALEGTETSVGRVAEARVFGVEVPR